MVSHIYPAIQGLSNGLVFTQAKRLEDSVRAGENTYITALLQTVQAATAVTFADMALEAAGQQPLSFVLRYFTYLTPALIAFAKANNLVPEAARPVLLFLHHNLSTFHEIAVAVYGVALIYFGQTAFAVSALSILAVGFLDRNGWLPVSVRQFVHRYSEPLQIATGVIAGSILDRFFVFLNVATWVATAYQAYIRSHTPNVVLPQGNLDLQKMQDFLSDRVGFAVNPQHIHSNVRPPVPQVDIEMLLQAFDHIDWTGARQGSTHIHTLREKYRVDARFVEEYRDPDLKTDEEILEIARSALTTFIHSVKENRILTGEPVDYEKLHDYLKFICKHVQDQNNEITQVDIVMRLAVEGGKYCGPGKFEAAESIYAQIMDNNVSLSFHDKILHCLQSERNLWIQKMYSLSGDNPIARFVDWNDIHMYNMILNSYGDHYGLRMTAAENDAAAIIDPITKLLISTTIGRLWDMLFWQEHRLEELTETIIQAIENHQLPRAEVYTFWQEWIERQQIPESRKEALREEISDIPPKLFNKHLEINGRMNPQFVALMLFDMGIAELHREPEELLNTSSTWSAAWALFQHPELMVRV